MPTLPIGCWTHFPLICQVQCFSVNHRKARRSLALSPLSISFDNSVGFGGACRKRSETRHDGVYGVTRFRVEPTCNFASQWEPCGILQRVRGLPGGLQESPSVKFDWRSYVDNAWPTRPWLNESEKVPFSDVCCLSIKKIVRMAPR